MILQNLHNHTLFSDGSFLPEEVITAAVRGGLDLVGISDHFYTGKIFQELSYQEWLDQFWPKYLYSLDHLKQYFEGQITVAAGIEIDSCLQRSAGKLENFPWADINQKLDYILVEYVGENSWDGLPVESLPQLRQYSDIPVILAHPDLDVLARTQNLPRFFASLQKNNIAVEIVSGKRNRWFWNHHDPGLLQGICISVGTDTHNDICEVTNLGQASAFIEKNNLAGQLLFNNSEKP